MSSGTLVLKLGCHHAAHSQGCWGMELSTRGGWLVEIQERRLEPDHRQVPVAFPNEARTSFQGWCAWMLR